MSATQKSMDWDFPEDLVEPKKVDTASNNPTFLDIEQNGLEWIIARLGKLTGSSIAKVMAHEEVGFGDPAKNLAVDLAIQQITGKVSNHPSYSNSHMKRGREQEPIARQLYEIERYCLVDNGGFFDNGNTGCSPDGLIDNDGIIEIKSVIASTHYNTIKKSGLDPAYKWQRIFNLKETRREWLDYVSFCADFPEGKQLFIKRIFAKDLQKEFARIDKRVEKFNTLLNKIKDDILNLK